MRAGLHAWVLHVFQSTRKMSSDNSAAGQDQRRACVCCYRGVRVCVRGCMCACVHVSVSSACTCIRGVLHACMRIDPRTGVSWPSCPTLRRTLRARMHATPCHATPRQATPCHALPRLYACMHAYAHMCTGVYVRKHVRTCTCLYACTCHRYLQELEKAMHKHRTDGYRFMWVDVSGACHGVACVGVYMCACRAVPCRAMPCRGVLPEMEPLQLVGALGELIVCVFTMCSLCVRASACMHAHACACACVHACACVENRATTVVRAADGRPW